MKSTLAWASLIFSATSCARELPPRAQVVLHVETDATVAPAPGATPASPRGAPLTLFDRLRVEFFEPLADAPCDECVREFGATTDVFAEHRASVGFVPHEGGGQYRARITLYRQAGTAGPRIASSIVRTVFLPGVGAEGVTHLWTELHVADVGIATGSLDEPVAVSRSPIALGVGSWDADVRRGCSAPPHAGEACVEGGSFWMGSASHPIEGREHLVKLSPFFVDAHEVTVGEFRASGLAQANDPIRRAECHYSNVPADAEDLPLDCISHSLALRYCESLGKTLLTEAQFERIATGLVGADYPWGSSLPVCEDAIYARNSRSSTAAYNACVPRGPGPQKAGSGRLDRLALNDVDVVDLAGNLSEWMRDTYQEEGEPCLDLGVRVDPVCTSNGKTPGHAVRGGSFADSVLSLRASGRTMGSTDDSGAPSVGFRCARPD